MSLIKNDLLLRTLRKETVERPPVWMMRQAGRYLPDYLKLKAKYDFFTRVQKNSLKVNPQIEMSSVIFRFNLFSSLQMNQSGYEHRQIIKYMLYFMSESVFCLI